MKEVDILIVGSGLSGLALAYFLRNYTNYSILISTKTRAGFGTSTFYSQGAFRCPGVSYSEEDYVKDTIEGGRYLNRRYLVELLARECRDSISLLRNAGIVLRETQTGFRVVSDDPLFPGRELTVKLANYLVKFGVEFLGGATMLDVFKLESGGYLTIHAVGGDLVAVGSRVVVLATGGAANAYIRSDNPVQLSCDGHGVSLKLGLPLVDMEFVQFFPLGVAEDGKPAAMIPFTKGRLLNKFGEDILHKYGLGSLGRAVVTARDALSRSMMLEVRSGRSIDGAISVEPEEVSDDLSLAGFEMMRRLGLKKPVKVLPTAHYTMGGVEVGPDLETGLPGVYVVGELVGGVHGANRLGGNALTTCVTLSRRVALSIARYLEEKFGVEKGSLIGLREVRDTVGSYSFGESALDPVKLRYEVRKLMWEKVGVLRTSEELEEAVDYLYRVAESLSRAEARNVRELVALREAENTVYTSISIALSALKREESRGSHYRLDHPEERSEWVKSLRVVYRDGKVSIAGEVSVG